MKTSFEELESPYLDGELEFVVPTKELSNHLAHVIGESPFANFVCMPGTETSQPAHSGIEHQGIETLGLDELGFATDFENLSIAGNVASSERFDDELIADQSSAKKTQAAAIFAAAQAGTEQPWADVEAQNPPMLRAFNPNRNCKTGIIRLTAEVAGVPIGGSFRWTTPDPARLTILSPERLSTDILAGSPGLTTIRFEVFDRQKTRVRYVTTDIGVPQFFAITEVTNARREYTAFVPEGRTIRDSYTFDAVLGQLGLQQHKPMVISQIRTAVERVLVPRLNQGRLIGHNLRLIWMIGLAGEKIPDSVFNPRKKQHPTPEESYYTLVQIGGYPANSRPELAGITLSPTGLGDPRTPNERIMIFPGSFDLVQSGTTSTPEARDLQDKVRRLMEYRRANSNDQASLDLLICAFSRYVANLICHEVYHSLVRVLKKDRSSKAVDAEGHPTARETNVLSRNRDFFARTAIIVSDVKAFPRPHSYRIQPFGGQQQQLTKRDWELVNIVFPLPPENPFRRNQPGRHEVFDRAFGAKVNDLQGLQQSGEQAESTEEAEVITASAGREPFRIPEEVEIFEEFEELDEELDGADESSDEVDDEAVDDEDEHEPEVEYPKSTEHEDDAGVDFLTAIEEETFTPGSDDRFVVLVSGYNYFAKSDDYAELARNRARVIAAKPEFANDDSLVFVWFSVADGKVYINRRRGGAWKLKKTNGWTAIDEFRFSASTKHSFTFEAIDKGRHYAGANEFRQDAPNTVMSITDIYLFLCNLGHFHRGRLMEFSVLSHGFWNGPILVNTQEQSASSSDTRNPSDKDGRGRKDFKPANLSAANIKDIQDAFNADGFSWIWGCFVTKAARAVIQGVADSKRRRTPWGKRVRGLNGAAYRADGTTPDTAVFRFSFGRDATEGFSRGWDSAFFPTGVDHFDKTFAEIKAFAKKHSDDTYCHALAVATNKPCLGPPLGTSSNYADKDPYRPGTPVVHWVERGKKRPASEGGFEANYSATIEFFDKTMSMPEDSEGRGYIRYSP